MYFTLVDKVTSDFDVNNLCNFTFNVVWRICGVPLKTSELSIEVTYYPILH
jgi:hypothetical protein